jgi:hypothetical protein
MFGQDREKLRQAYYDAWHKRQTNAAMTPLEMSIAQVIEQHPEYHTIFDTETSLQQEYWVENGETNPFLHMGLHLGLHEQISTNRPDGIRELYQQLQAKLGDAHNIEHEMMECLTESLWLAQRNNQVPSEEGYLNALKELNQKQV